MSVLQVLILLLSAASCCAAPRPENGGCKAPEILNGFLKTPKVSYDLGSYAEFECNENYVKNIPTGPKCEKGQWTDQPLCYSPCKISPGDLTLSNVQLVEPEPDTDKSYAHGTELEVSCKSGFRRPNQQTFIIDCYDGKFKYLRCFSGMTCRITQEGLDGNNLQLDEVHNNDVFYKVGETITFKCQKGFSHRDRQPTGTCTADEIIYPKCTGIGEQCGPPPTVQFGDTTSIRKLSYKSGESVEYKCPNYYTLKGEQIVRCQNGVWGEAPVCLEPCTAKKKNMEENNILLRWLGDEKLYTPHGSVTEFACKSGYESLPNTRMRIICDHGKLEYPKCFRNGYCVLQQSEMLANNVHYNESTVVDNGQTITFHCNEEMMADKSLKATCTRGKIQYPKCTAAKDSCEQTPKVPYAIVKEEKIYNHGESAEFTCDNNYGFSGGDSAKCVKGEWLNVPICVSTSCNPPPAVPNSKINGKPKNTYASGDKVTYSCNNGYSFEKSSTGEAKCENTEWINVPVCRRVGEQCGTPPTVQFGDITSIRKLSYKSGDSVEYKCPNFYTLKGEQIVKCQNGVWGEAPVCLEPCTAKKKNMEENNIQLRWIGDEKLYTPHGGVTEFACKSGFESLPNTQMRIICDHGKLEYPKCFRYGYCVLQQSEMLANNVYYNESTVVDNGQIITFQCNEEMMADKSLKATCTRGKIQYPKCTAASGCKAPEILNGFLKTPKDSYDLGSYAEFECNKDYVKNIPTGPKCEKGQWTDQPLCYNPCKVSPEDLTVSNIQLVEPEPDTDKSYAHGTELEVSCKPRFRRPNQHIFIIDCYDGKFKYLRCFSGMTCRITQEGLDGNNLQLDEVHNNEVYYKVEETITFKCQKGFSHRDRQPTGTCTAEEIIYPKCTAGSSV